MVEDDATCCKLSFGKGDDPFSRELFNFFSISLRRGRCAETDKAMALSKLLVLDVPIPRSGFVTVEREKILE